MCKFCPKLFYLWISWGEASGGKTSCRLSLPTPCHVLVTILFIFIPPPESKVISLVKMWFSCMHPITSPAIISHPHLLWWQHWIAQIQEVIFNKADPHKLISYLFNVNFFIQFIVIHCCKKLCWKWVCKTRVVFFLWFNFTEPRWCAANSTIYSVTAIQIPAFYL